LERKPADSDNKRSWKEIDHLGTFLPSCRKVPHFLVVWCDKGIKNRIDVADASETSGLDFQWQQPQDTIAVDLLINVFYFTVVRYRGNPKKNTDSLENFTKCLKNYK